MKIFICFISFFWSTLQGFAQLKIVDFEQIDSLQKIEKRNVIVFIHTDWCKYCKAMINGTFKNETVVKNINEKLYFIDLDAEEKRKIVFSNATFNFKPNGSNLGIHELAIELGTIDNQICYPILCVLNEKNEIIFQYSGFLMVQDIKKILSSL